MGVVVGVLWGLIHCMWVRVLCVGCVEVLIVGMGEIVD